MSEVCSGQVHKTVAKGLTEYNSYLLDIKRKI
jgi:hypothetical protein